MFLRSVLLLAALCVPALAQSPIAEIPNATLIGAEGITITAVSSATAVLQFGIGTTWCTTITAPKLPLLVSWASPNPAVCPFDPIAGIAKSIVAQQQAAAYTVTYTASGSTKKIVVTVPALPPPPPPPAPKTTTYTITLQGTFTLTDGAPMPTTLTIANQVITVVKQ